MKNLTKRQLKQTKEVVEGSMVDVSLRKGYTKIIGGELYRGNPPEYPFVKVSNWDVNPEDYVNTEEK